MSGGSFNYLCYKDAEDLFSYTEELENMVTALRELGNDIDAEKTQKILDSLEEYRNNINKSINDLRESWRKVEWYHSGDIDKPNWDK